MPSWRDLLAHDGVVLVELTLFDSGSGGPPREISSGFRADWTWDHLPSAADADADAPMLPVRAPIDLDEDRGCIRPGETAVVRAHPFQPHVWAVLPVGTTVRLCRLTRAATHGFTIVGEGSIVAMIDLPDHPVALRDPDRPLGPGQARLRRREP